MAYTPSQKLVAFKKVIKALESGKTLGNILDEPNMPSRTGFYSWLKSEEGFEEKYVRAKELSAEALYDEMIRIAETPIMGDETTIGPNGVTITTKDQIHHRRLLLDTIKWRLGKEAPRKYGDKLDVTSDGEKVGQVTIFELPSNGRE